ncbi:MAG TPA: RpiB/LacA/LacB family sugar-phosphate isomerase [Candidatus Limnocylindrales bacterium]|nr:RpiB/LacA/LacB family sugar-phosphate isomerase [Candidatus Limnocylindrales bacterium]
MPTDTPILLGADDAGLGLLEIIADDLRTLGRAVETYRPDDPLPDDATTPADEVDYPDVAERVANAIRSGRSDRGILICGTGIGMAIAANKVPGVRAAQAHDVYSAERARKSNDAQILTLGARVIGPESAKTVVHAWLESEFAGGASTRKVAKLERLDERRSAAEPR